MDVVEVAWVVFGVVGGVELVVVVLFGLVPAVVLVVPPMPLSRLIPSLSGRCRS